MKGLCSFKMKSHKILYTFLLISILLVMCRSLRLFFTWNLSLLLTSLLGILACLLYVVYNSGSYRKVTKDKLLFGILLIFLFMYEYACIGANPIFALIHYTCIFFMSFFLVLSEIQFKKKLLNSITICVQILVAISLLGWILFLLKIPLPHYYSETDAFYSHTVYYLFVLNGTPDQLIPRFAGMFLEPGHLGTTCCFLLHINHYNFKKKGNVILLFGVLFSLSLAAYGLLVNGYVLYLFFNSKKGFIYILLFSVLLLIAWGGATKYNAGDNYLNVTIFSRLVFEDGEMSGGNRTTEFFDAQFERFVKTERVWFGVGREAYDTKGATNLVNGCAGWKRYVFIRGYIGVILLVFFWLVYCYRYRSKYAFSFMIVFLVGNIIRDYPLAEFWLFILILAIPVLSQEEKVMNKKIIN